MISIVTCIFNQSEDFFRSCARSVCQQTEKIEWIVVDDGSSPGFRLGHENVLNELPSSLRVNWIQMSENSGLSNARNAGLAKCSGDWIVILDSDDELSPNMASMLESLDRLIGLACFGVEYVKIDGSVEHRAMQRWRSIFSQFAFTPADPFLWFDFYYHGLIARAQTFERINGYDPMLAVGEDQDALLRACEAVSLGSIWFGDHVGYRYRENTAGVCWTRWEEVEANYASTMVSAARRRGADFDACRLVAERQIDGARIDEYSYRQKGRWIRWAEVAGNDIC